MKDIYIKRGLIALNSILGVVSLVLLSSFVDSSLFNKPDVASLPKESSRRTFEEVIQINVLNGCGQQGLAGRVQKGLRRMGFDVVEVGNFEQTIDQTIIIDRLGDRKSAYKLAHTLGIDEKFIFTEIDSSLYIRASLVLGSDYKEYPLLPTNIPLSISGLSN